jgi:hypothetical protein
MIKILPPGTDVTITQAGAIGKVSQVVIGYNSIRYEVTYYIDGVRQVVPADEAELQVCASQKKVSMGFK